MTTSLNEVDLIIKSLYDCPTLPIEIVDIICDYYNQMCVHERKNVCVMKIKCSFSSISHLPLMKLTRLMNVYWGYVDQETRDIPIGVGIRLFAPYDLVAHNKTLKQLKFETRPFLKMVRYWDYFFDIETILVQEQQFGLSVYRHVDLVTLGCSDSFRSMLAGVEIYRSIIYDIVVVYFTPLGAHTILEAVFKRDGCSSGFPGLILFSIRRVGVRY